MSSLADNCPPLRSFKSLSSMRLPSKALPSIQFLQSASRMSTSHMSTNHMFTSRISTRLISTGVVATVGLSLMARAEAYTLHDKNWAPQAIPQSLTMAVQVDELVNLVSPQVPSTQMADEEIVASSLLVGDRPESSAPESAITESSNLDNTGLESNRENGEAAVDLTADSKVQPFDAALGMVDAVFPELQAAGGRYWTYQQVHGLMDSSLLQVQLESEAAERRAVTPNRTLLSSVLPGFEIEDGPPSNAIFGIMGILGLVIFQLGRSRSV
jgi:hypothetical protein